MRLKVKLLFESGRWSEFCKASGTNEWAVNEGLLSENDEVDIPETLALEWLGSDSISSTVGSSVIDKQDTCSFNKKEE